MANVKEATRRPRPVASTRKSMECRRRFLDFFPEAFRDVTYLETERAYKWDAHARWESELRPLLVEGRAANRDVIELAQQAVRIEGRTNLLFSFEKMALRDAVVGRAGARRFVDGLTDWLYGDGTEKERFAAWVRTVAELPRRQTRVVTWPIVSVFGFIARPRAHILVKPNVMRRAAEAYGYPLEYASAPQWDTYTSVLDFARVVRRDLRDWRPRDMIDIQSFLWVQGSDEYR